MASKTNCVINGIAYYRIRKKVGIKLNKKGEWIPDLKPFYGKNKTDAEKQWEEWKDTHKQGINKEEYAGKLLQYWMENVFLNGKSANGTKIRYNGAYKKYLVGNDILNQNRMAEINGLIIQNLFNALKDIPHSTKIAIRNVLTLFFKWAELHGYCRNPMLVGIEIGENGNSPSGISVFTDEEIEKIIKGPPTHHNSYNQFMFCLMLGTGLREGEIIALTAGDVANGHIRVVKQVVTNTDKKRAIDETKTSNSERYVPVPEALKEELENRRTGKADTDHIFLSRQGNFMDASNLIRSFKRYLISVGVDYKEPHTLRRTYTTKLLEKGVSIDEVAELLGDTVATVAKYYAFVSNERKIAAVDKINELFM